MPRFVRAATRGQQVQYGDTKRSQAIMQTGNSYTRTDAVEERGRFRRIAEKVVGPNAISDTLPLLPRTPPRRQRTIFEVPAGANAESTRPEGTLSHRMGEGRGEGMVIWEFVERDIRLGTEGWQRGLLPEACR